MASVAMQKAAQDLVERSRLGDQNATAMILEIRRCALEGNATAQTGLALLRRIAESTPLPDFEQIEPVMGEESLEALEYVARRGPILGLGALLSLPDTAGEKGLTAAAVLLANGPSLMTKRLVSDVGVSIDDPAFRRLFFYGVRFCGQDGCKLANEVRTHNEHAPLFVHAGRCVGLARSIQRVRLPDSRISLFSRLAGWEHGE